MARSPGGLGPGPAAEMLAWNCTAPPSETIQRPSKVSGLGVMVATQQEVKNLACRKSVRVAGSRPQGPVGQVSRGLGARAPRAWGPAHQGPGPFPHKNHPLKLRFFRKPPGGSLAKAWVSAETAASEVGTWRETKPGYPPYPPPLHPAAFWGCKEGFHPLRLRQPSNTPPKVGGPQYVPYRCFYNPL